MTDLTDINPGTADRALWESVSAELVSLVLVEPQPADMEFAEQLYMAVTEPLGRALGRWDEHEERQSYRGKVDRREVRIILRDGERIGWLQLRQEQVIRIRQIHLTENARGSGIGTTIIVGILQVATAMRVPVELSFLPNNPASDLYRRLGFTETSRLQDRVNLRWAPPSRSPNKLG